MTGFEVDLSRLTKIVKHHDDAAAGIDKVLRRKPVGVDVGLEASLLIAEILNVSDKEGTVLEYLQSETANDLRAAATGYQSTDNHAVATFRAGEG